MSAAPPAAANGRVPVTMLSGFLGAGKTTLLRYLLENSKIKIACIVNDVASVNIDAKLVRNDRNRGPQAGKGEAAQTNTTKDLADTVELQNGCACCNLQDELFASFEQVLAMGDKRGEPYARIVLENSGVAEPANLRDKFREAEEVGHPLMQRIYLDTLVTVVDASTFGKEFASRQPLAARPDLGDGGNLRPVVDLLVEQIECADFLVLNKVDLMDGAPVAATAAGGGAEESQAAAEEGQDGSASSAAALQELQAIVGSLNPLAKVVPSTQGKVPLDVVFGSPHSVVAKLNIEGLHRGAVAAAKALQHAHEHEGHHDHHKHDGEAAAGKKHSHEDHVHHDDCAACTHDHSHDHKHDHTPKEHKAHTHDHEHKHEAKKHSHEDHDHHDDCAACTHDHSHDHAHGHHHHDHDHAHTERQTTLAAKRFGIVSFVYSRRRPFHPQRLKDMVLKWLPVTTNTAIESEAPELGDAPIKKVLRSKGFMWMSNSHSTAYYWSHAGQHFEIRDEGDWWSAVPDADWPTEEASKDMIVADWATEDGGMGDRRQEIVFIGVGMDEAKISAQLDGALLTDEEMDKYKTRWAAVPDPSHPGVEEAIRAKKAKLDHHDHHDHGHTHDHAAEPHHHHHHH